MRWLATTRPALGGGLGRKGWALVDLGHGLVRLREGLDRLSGELRGRLDKLGKGLVRFSYGGRVYFSEPFVFLRFALFPKSCKRQEEKIGLVKAAEDPLSFPQVSSGILQDTERKFAVSLIFVLSFPAVF